MSVGLHVYPFDEKVLTKQELEVEIQRQMGNSDFLRGFGLYHFRKREIFTMSPDKPIQPDNFYTFMHPEQGCAIYFDVIPLEGPDDLSREYLRWLIQRNNIGGALQRKLIQQVEHIPFYFAVSFLVRAIPAGLIQSYFQLVQALGVALGVLTDGLIVPDSAFGPPDSLYIPSHFQTLRVPQMGSLYAPRQLRP